MKKDNKKGFASRNETKSHEENLNGMKLAHFIKKYSLKVLRDITSH